MTDDFSQFMSTPQPAQNPQQIGGFDQFMQATQDQPAAQQSTISSIVNSQPVQSVEAATGGAIDMGSKLLNQSFGAGTDAYKDPITQIHDIQNGKPFSDPNGTPPDILSSGMRQTMANNPMSTLTGEVVGAIGTTAAVTAITKGAINPITGGMSFAGLNGGTITTIAANGLANSILAGPDNRLFGGAVGTLAGSAGEMIGTAISKGQAMATVNTQTKQAVGKINEVITGDPGTIAVKSRANMWETVKAQDDQLFDGFKNVQSTLPDSPRQIQVGPLVNRASLFLDQHGDELSPAQTNSVRTLIKDTVNSESLDDLHAARKTFAYDYSKFTEGKPLSGDAFQGYKGVTDSINSVMENNANMLGVGDQYRAANIHYQTSTLPMINSGAKDTADALKNSGTDPMSAAKLADTELGKYVNANKPAQAQAYLSTLDPTGRQAFEMHSVNTALKGAMTPNGVDGVKFIENIRQIQNAIPGIHSERTMGIINGLDKTVKEATTIAGISIDTAKIPGYVKVGAVGSLGATAGGLAGGAPGAVAGTAIALSLAKMVNSKAGQSTLIWLGQHGREAGQAFINATLMSGEMAREGKMGQDQPQLTDEQVQAIQQQQAPQKVQ